MAKRMGFEGKLYWGTAGSTAATELKIARDVSYKLETTEVDVSDRNSIVDLSAAAGVKFSMDFEVNNQSTDAFVAAARVACAAGTAVAFRTRDSASGWGVDADFLISLDESQPLRDAQRIKVTCSPTDANGRTPTWI
jgi:hypothetical protein